MNHQVLVQSNRLRIVGIATIYVCCLLPVSLVVAQDNQDADDKTGTIEGVVTYLGEVPKSKVRDNGGQQRDLISVDRKSHGLRFVLAFLECDVANQSGGNQQKSKEKEKESNQTIIDQVEHTFVPHLIAIRDGDKVKFTNGDAANHNVRAISFESKNQFNVFTGAGGEYVHQFVSGKKLRPIVLSCDIHPWMRAWIYPFAHPYFAVSDQHGKFHIRNVLPGKYELIIQQPDVGYRKKMAVEVKPQKATSVEVKVTRDDLKIR